jgi:ubiquinone/menaquinone biosynthesis C-methylase UbiE
MSVPRILSDMLSEDVSLNLVESGVYSVYSRGDAPGAYDTAGASWIYDVIACNRVYNRLMWGYSTKAYATLCEDLLAATPGGAVLDLACGSLAFTEEIYAACLDRPIVFLDQSLKLLRKGKRRLEKRGGKRSQNMFFLHADALSLPFKAGVFYTVISLNLLHCLEDATKVLRELKRVLKEDGNAALTTLVQSRCWRDRYLNLLANSGALFSRSREDLLAAFDDTEMRVTPGIRGSLAFIRYGSIGKED